MSDLDTRVRDLDTRVRDILELGMGDIRAVLQKARARGMDLADVLVVVGAPRLVAPFDATVKVCDCPVLAIGIARRIFVECMYGIGKHGLARDLDEPLLANQLRLMVITSGFTSVVTIGTPTGGADRPHVCGVHA